MHVASRLSKVAPSATLALAQRAREMAAAGQNVVSLTAGEPDFPTPRHILDALKASIDAGKTRYTAVTGTPQLRTAIRDKYVARGINYGLDQIIACTGAKQALYNGLMASVDDGQEVVFAAPYWLSYKDIVQLAGGVPVPIATHEDQGFLLSPQQLSDAITSKTRAVMLNSPSNPTGAVYGRDDLTALAEVLDAHPEVLIVTDEIYEHLVYGDSGFASILDVAPQLVDRTLVVSGCSKSYAMTGLRLGWATGPQPWIAGMAKLQGQCTSNPTAPVQDAGIAAITGDHAPVQAMIEAFDARRRAVVNGLNALPDVTCFEPKGAFYAFPNFAAYKGRQRPTGEPIESASDICQHLLDTVQVVAVPGAPFGAPDYLRVSFATDQATLDEGLARIAESLAQLI